MRLPLRRCLSLKHLQAMLPYSRWLDYCSVAYLVPEHAVAPHPEVEQW